MISRGLVRLFGGWWKQRERCLDSRGLWGRIMVALYRANMREHGSYISLHAVFAAEPRMPHGPTGVFIAPGVYVGRGVTIHQHVMLARREGADGAPTVGDGVQLGAGAIVLGRVVVGQRARIGAGAVVVHDVPAGATAVSPAARVIPREASEP